MFNERTESENENEDKICTICWGACELRFPDGQHGVKIVLCSCKVPSNCDNPTHDIDPW